jgi:hypothetical protein
VFFAAQQMTLFPRLAVVVGVAVFAWLVVAEFLGGKLLREEIAQQLSSS